MGFEEAARLAEVILVIIGIGGILYKLGGMTEKFEMIGKQQAVEISDLKDAVKEFVKNTARVERMEERQLNEGKRLDNLESRLNKYINGIHQD